MWMKFYGVVLFLLQLVSLILLWILLIQKNIHHIVKSALSNFIYEKLQRINSSLGMYANQMRCAVHTELTVTLELSSSYNTIQYYSNISFSLLYKLK